MNKKAITPNPSLPFSPIVISNGMAYVSGQVSIDANAKLIEGDIEAQTRVTFENLRKVLEGAGLGIENVIKTTCFLLNREDLAGFNKIYAEYFTSDKPARSTVFVSSLPIEGTIVEIDCIATAD